MYICIYNIYIGTLAHSFYTYYYTRAFVSTLTVHARVYYILCVLVMYVHCTRMGVWTGHCEFFHENNKFNDACAAEENKKGKKRI